MKDKLLRFLRNQGILVQRYSPRYSHDALVKALLQRFGIDLVIDVGANSGQYGRHLRALGYMGELVSMEPLSAAFAQLKECAAKDARWQVHNVAIGTARQSTQINVSENSFSSSLLGMETAHSEAAAASRYVRTETIEVVPLGDVVTAEMLAKHKHIFLQVDVQGFEREVIEGALEVLPKLCMVELELSMVPLYEGGPLYRELIDRMEELDFELYTMAPEFRHPETHRLLQTNGLFVHKRYL